MGRGDVDESGSPFSPNPASAWVYRQPLQRRRPSLPGGTSGRVPAFLITNFTRPEPSADAPQIPPAWKLRIFFIYPLGIMSGRPYDGGLSFSAKMQIEAEGGV